MKIVLAAILLAASFGASATNNNPPNECGNHGNNCQPSGGSNEANSHANGGNGYGGSGTGVGVGVGLGIGQGGAGGEGGEGGRGGAGGTAISGGGAGGSVLGSGNSSNLNSAKGGDASQGQLQGQQQSNVGVNSQGQSSTNVSGSKSIAQMASENTVNASSQNANQSSSAGNTTVVGGDSTLVERNAPPVFLGAVMPTNCGGSVQAGGSTTSGAGAFGFSYVGRECEKRMVADRFQQYGQVDVACRIMKTSKAFKAAVKDDPSLASIDCAMKPAPMPVVSPVVPVDFHAHKVPRG